MLCETRGTVRKTIEEGESFLVSLPNHDGYFKIPPSPHAQELRKKILSAQNLGEEVSFTYDRDLNIIKIK